MGFFFQVKPNMKQAVPREYHTLWHIYKGGALFTLNTLFCLFSGVASPCKHFLLTSQQRQWPLNPGSANRREASCGFLWILEKENVLLFFNVFYSFCFWDVDLRGCVASLTSYSHLSFVADFVSLWVWKLLKNICTQRLSRTGQSGPRRERNAIECDTWLKDEREELTIGWLTYVGVVCSMWVWSCWFWGRSCCEWRKKDLVKDLNERVKLYCNLFLIYFF